MNKVQFMTCDLLVLTIYYIDKYIVYEYIKCEPECGPFTYCDVMTINKCYRNCCFNTVLNINFVWHDPNVQDLLDDMTGDKIGLFDYDRVEVLQDDIASIPVLDRIRNKNIIKWIWNDNGILFDEHDLCEILFLNNVSQINYEATIYAK